MGSKNLELDHRFQISASSQITDFRRRRYNKQSCVFAHVQFIKLFQNYKSIHFEGVAHNNYTANIFRCKDLNISSWY